MLPVLPTMRPTPASVPPTTRGHTRLMGLVTLLFALRVVGQAVQRWWPQPGLPEFSAFQGSGLPYWVLLSAQLAIVALMLRVWWRMARRAPVPNRRLGRALMWTGALYMACSLLRIVVGLAVPAAPAWFTAWIPALFHLVLAGFVLAVADVHLRSSATLV